MNDSGINKNCNNIEEVSKNETSDKQSSYVKYRSSESFSKNIIWSMLNEFYNDVGIEAWDNFVPFKISNNPTIGIKYANNVFRFIQDGLRNGFVNNSKTIYIVELGTGIGKFSYYFVLHLKQLLVEFNMNVKFCYIMTDTVNDNIDFWMSQEQLKPLVEEGLIDFALYSIGNDDDVHLKNSVCSLSEVVDNPMVLVANYLIDSLPHDLFNICDGVVKEGLSNTWVKKESIEEGAIVSHKGMIVDFEYQNEFSGYQDSRLNSIVDSYRETIEDSHILIPIGFLQCIDFFSQLSKNKLFIIAGDKGYTDLDEIDWIEDKRFIWNDIFAMEVNFDSIAKYIDCMKGSSLLMEKGHWRFKVVNYLVGGDLHKFPETVKHYNDICTDNSLYDMNIIARFFEDRIEDLNLVQLISLYKLSHYDPDTLVLTANHLLKIIHEIKYSEESELVAALSKMEAHIYDTPFSFDVYVELGRIYMALKEYKRAIHFFSLSNRFKNSGSSITGLIAVCYNFMGNKEKVKETLLEINTDDPMYQQIQKIVGI